MKFFQLLGGIACACTNPVVRREIRELSPAEVGRLTGAINELHRQGKLEEFSRVHVANKLNAHGIPAFLPWHRYFVRKFEMALQQIDASVVLPYWDWSLDSQHPHASEILRPSLYGGNGDAKHCVVDGPFANWQMTFPTPHCLSRNFDRGSRLSRFGYPEELLLYLNEPNFSDFSVQFDEKHVYVHLAIGGDMAPMFSPNDPLFFLHHVFVDMMWATWQDMHPTASQYEGSRHGKTVATDDILVPFGITVESTLRTTSDFYCYTYPKYPRPILPASATVAQREAVATSIAKNPFFNGFLVNATMDSATELLRQKLTDLQREAEVTSAAVPIRNAGPFSDKLLSTIFLNRVEFRRNDEKSIVLASLLNQLPGFESLTHFRRHLIDQPS